ncbi:MAG: NAD(P)/FAD-dependent oxidoreductase [bacterium]
MMYDVIVIGLGPAGATAAYTLSKAGLQVLALEKQGLPRYKPCGGGITPKIKKILSFPDWEPLIENTIYDLILSFKGKDTQRFHAKQPLAYLISRDKFDFYLVEKALHAGTQIHASEPVIGISMKSDSIEIKTEKQTYLTKYLIGADGAPSFTAHTASTTQKPKPIYWTGLTSEVNATLKKELEAPIDHAIYIYFGNIPSGYGWIFPKQNRYAIGIAGYQHKLKQPQRVFTRFLESQSMLEHIQLNKPAAHLIPVYQSNSPKLLDNRILLVGDAAGLVDPYLGEGIYYAIRSGQIAGQTIQDAITNNSPDLSAYTETIRTEFDEQFRIAQLICDAVYRVPAFSYHFFKSNPGFFDTYCRVLSGETGYTDLYTTAKLKVNAMFNFMQSQKFGF